MWMVEMREIAIQEERQNYHQQLIRANLIL